VQLAVVAIALGIVVALLYGPAIDFPLVADDWLLIYDASQGGARSSCPTWTVPRASSITCRCKSWFCMSS
jgi:hypothetical protein